MHYTRFFSLQIRAFFGLFPKQNEDTPHDLNTIQPSRHFEGGRRRFLQSVGPSLATDEVPEMQARPALST